VSPSSFARAQGRALLPRPDLESARDKTLADVIAPGLRVLFVGINPGLYSAAVGHNFGRPGNRFWPALALAGLTPRRLAPSEERTLLDHGLGITNIVGRATARAEELSRDELLNGARELEAKVLRFAPRVLAVLGITAYRSAWARPRAVLGEQPEWLAGARLWVLPNPSGLNAHHQLADLARLYAELATV
jgi:double-stranded uracil-DNA glycosylase